MSDAVFIDRDPFVCEWTRDLIKAGQLSGEVIEDDVRNVDLEPPAHRVHWFHGIGMWELALRWAEWDDNDQVWTASLPCQPWSTAGKGKGHDDERDVWPVFREHVEKHRPATIFGEQVASQLGRDWLSSVRSELEALGYAFGAADLAAASIGAPHIRQRLFWVAYANGVSRPVSKNKERKGSEASGGGSHGVSGHRMADTNSLPAKAEVWERIVENARSSTSILSGFWDDHEWIGRQDRRRPIEPGTCPLAYGYPRGVDVNKAIGNAIVPQLAAVFIRSAMEAFV